MQGIEGPQGPIGEQGSIGLQGTQGSIGQQGQKGEQGEKGEQGPIGLTGPQGQIGETGPQGSIGQTHALPIVNISPLDYTVNGGTNTYAFTFFIYDPNINKFYGNPKAYATDNNSNLTYNIMVDPTYAVYNIDILYNNLPAFRVVSICNKANQNLNFNYNTNTGYITFDNSNVTSSTDIEISVYYYNDPYNGNANYWNIVFEDVQYAMSQFNPYKESQIKYIIQPHS